MQQISARPFIRIRRWANRSAWPPSCTKASVPICRRKRRSSPLLVRPSACGGPGQANRNGASCEGRAVFFETGQGGKRTIGKSGGSAKKSRPRAGKRYVVQRIGAFGQSNRVTGN